MTEKCSSMKRGLAILIGMNRQRNETKAIKRSLPVKLQGSVDILKFHEPRRDVPCDWL